MIKIQSVNGEDSIAFMKILFMFLTKLLLLFSVTYVPNSSFGSPNKNG